MVQFCGHIRDPDTQKHPNINVSRLLEKDGFLNKSNSQNALSEVHASNFCKMIGQSDTEKPQVEL